MDSKFDEDRDEVINKTFQQGVSTIVEIADGPREWKKAQTLALTYPNRLWWAAGLHPYYADQGSPELFSQLKTHLSHSQCVALGEVGLDYAKATLDPDVQKKALLPCLQLALEMNKPLIIHCRDAFADLLPILKDFFPNKNRSNAPGVLHCFSGSHKDAGDLLDMGFFIGVDGPVGYPNAKTLRETIRTLPLEKIVLETDSPYLPPQKYRGKRNSPEYLPLIGQSLAQIFGVSLSDVARQTVANGLALFRLNHS